MSSSTELEQLVNQLESDGDLLHQVVHGDDATTVSTEGGSVKSLAKAQADMDATLNANMTSLTTLKDQAETAATAAQSAANDALTIKWKGAYDVGLSYQENDGVHFNGSGYICIVDAAIGITPLDSGYWSLLAAGTNQVTEQGDLLFHDGIGPARLPAGTAGQILQTGGVGGDPSWTALHDRPGCRVKALQVQRSGSGIGMYNSAYLMTDGTVRIVGNNGQGQLGIGAQSSRRLQPMTCAFPAGLTTVVKEVHLAGRSVFALMEDGTVYSWGYNGYGQLGQGDTNLRYVPTKIVGLTGITQMATTGSYWGDYTSVWFLDDQGRIWACGYNGYGQLGDGSTTNRLEPVQVSGAQNWVWVGCASAYRSYAFAIDASGNAFSWGYNGRGNLGVGNTTDQHGPTPVSLPGNVKTIVGNCDGDGNGNPYASTFWLLEDGRLYAAGYNNYGQLGVGDTTERTTPVEISALANVVDVSIGGGQTAHGMALLGDGSIRTWGRNNYGQLGVGNTTNQHTPQDPGLTDIVQIRGSGYYGYQFSMVLDSSGTLWSAGYNGNGQLGLGHATYQTSFQPACGIGLGGSFGVKPVNIAFNGENAGFCTHVLLSDGRVLSSGYNGHGQAGTDSSNSGLYAFSTVLF
ncbi:RCC1 domain-containing protein [Magnetococcus sp. PR-3]|uniref:RCC1 domain-containing protein n=1 Tax=Magnetococcus sp. PR-3 TaxID=3120355 RepID=UPI002FCE1E4B